MRRLTAILALALLGACTTADDLLPVSTGPVSSETATYGAVAIRAPRFDDRDPHDWTGRSPHHYDVHGTDVSKYQSSVDWHDARRNGISFAFIKATEGGDRLDDKFHRHWANAKAAGIPRGAYHFFYFCRPASEQAEWFIRHVPRDRTSLPPVLDMEWNPDSPSCKLRPAAATVRSEMRVFLTALERHYGKKPIIYTTIDFFDDNGLSSFKGYPYWLRSTAGHPTDRYGSHPFTFWQYTGTGIVPGIPGDADINVFNGNVSNWKKWLAANTR
ncbi:MAG TPA: GH25 family lysozyme [Rhizomicrobium sp.]|nr:GH25 family lysozyme [Rhizomicrobium sp.]